MARLIEVDLDVVEKEFYTDLTAFYHDSYGRGFTAGLKAVLGFLKKQPTIEAEPVKHGKWKAVPNRILIGRRVATQGTAWECSACNNSSKQYLPTMKFCPNCGARMDGE